MLLNLVSITARADSLRRPGERRTTQKFRGATWGGGMVQILTYIGGFYFLLLLFMARGMYVYRRRD
jgi:hypothetical protein